MSLASLSKVNKTGNDLTVIHPSSPAQNPLLFELTIDRVTSTAGINGTVYATFDYTFPKPVVVPALGTANSGSIPNVTLTQGAIASLDIIPLGYLDLINVDVNVR